MINWSALARQYNLKNSSGIAQNIQVAISGESPYHMNENTDDLIKSEQPGIGHPVTPKEIKQQIYGIFVNKSILIIGIPFEYNTDI